MAPWHAAHGRPGSAGAVHFTYVLPSTPTQALVEDTWFLPPGSRPPGALGHRAALRAYMAAHHGVDGFDVLFEEAGSLPMDPAFQPSTARRLLPLGTAGGARPGPAPAMPSAPSRRGATPSLQTWRQAACPARAARVRRWSA